MSKKPIMKIGMVEWLKVKVLISNTSTEKTSCRKRKRR
jgi:hypothetical protein